ncbi:MAG: MFS transporter [Leptospiraceae bacterium]|nr:MFS transporter [Leptospiraceae bacterium]
MNYIFYFSSLILSIGFLYILVNYAKGLKNSPREIWILFTAKLIEYAAYGASNMAFVLFLSKDCGLGDIAAGSYIGVWSTIMTCISILVGSVVDAIGVKKTLVIGMFAMLIGRLVMPFSNHLWIVTLFAFIPVAIGNALLIPVMSVGIKRFTTPENTALGFGLFYTLMNVGFALGGYIFDKVRLVYGEYSIQFIPFFEINISTYQIIFLVSFLLTVPSMLLILSMREGISIDSLGNIQLLKEKISVSNFIVNFYSEIRKSTKDTVSIMKTVFWEKSFWIYLSMLGILVFVKLVFYHFNYTFPKYGIRVLGEGTKVGAIYGILNPVIIIFLVPLIAHFTKKIKSYSMLIIGTIISTVSIFLATLPTDFFAFLNHTMFGQMILVDWLELTLEKQNPIIFGIVFFIVLFSLGEAIWSPRLMQFSAEIAPLGKEGTYISLSYLPYFLAKMITGPMSGWLIATYVPEGASSYPDHYMVWVWIGGVSALSPLGLLLFRSRFLKMS